MSTAETTLSSNFQKQTRFPIHKLIYIEEKL